MTVTKWQFPARGIKSVRVATYATCLILLSYALFPYNKIGPSIF